VQLDDSACQFLTVDDADLLRAPGFIQTIPEGISNSGDIVGSVSNGTTNQGFYATRQ